VRFFKELGMGRFFACALFQQDGRNLCCGLVIHLSAVAKTISDYEADATGTSTFARMEA